MLLLWRWVAGEGACTTIPQALSAEQHERAIAVPRACATSFPSQTFDGLLFVWMHAGPNALEESLRHPLNALRDMRQNDRVATPWHMREVMQSWDVLLENVMDPAHVPFSHHGVQGDRNAPTIPNFDKIELMDCVSGYKVTSPFKEQRGRLMNQTVQLQPPNHYQLIANAIADDKVDWGERVLCINMHLAPVTGGKTRMFTRCEFDTFANKPAGKLMKLRPTWHDHIERNTVLDGDGVFLARQTQLLRAGQVQRSKYYLPTPADLPAMALRRWLKSFAPNGVDFYADVRDPVDESGTLPRDVVLDRYNQHVKHCKSCSGALRNVRLALHALPALIAAAFLSLAAFLGQGQPLLSPLPLAAIGVMLPCAAGWIRLKKFERVFTFTDYVHAER